MTEFISIDRIVRLYVDSGYSDRLIFAAGTTFVLIAVFYSLNLLLTICYTFDLFPERKIQPNAQPDAALVREGLIHCVTSQFLITPVLLYLTYPVFSQMGMTVSGPLPNLVTVLRDLLVAVALNDTLFYWAHRGLHHKSIYKYIHKQHHKFKISIGIAAVYAHPVEDILANIIPTIAGCLLMGSHVTTLWLWLAIRMFETVDAHSGYNFSISPFCLLPFLGGAERHDYHHSHYDGCYGSFTLFWDYVTGTDKTYHAYKAAKLAKSK